MFILLKKQLIKAFILSMAVRRFAVKKGTQYQVDRIDAELEENISLLELVDKQLRELKTSADEKRMGFFEPV